MVRCCGTGWNLGDLRLDENTLYYGHASSGKAIFSIDVLDIDAEDKILTYAMRSAAPSEATSFETVLQ